MLSTTFFIYFKIHKYWIEKKHFFYVSPKKQFLEPNLIQKLQKKQKNYQKKILSDFLL